MKLPEHISYSQYNSYVKCPRNWYLGYIRDAESAQTWYVPIGSAVHEMVEDYLACTQGRATFKPESITAEQYFYPLISAQMEIEPDLSKWRAGGPKADPLTGDKALQRVRDCYEKALEFLGDIDVWEVEFDASGSLPGLSVPIKAFIDIVGEYKGKIKKSRGPMIVDWKSGSTKPDNFQLITYSALLRVGRLWPNENFYGRYAMLSPDASNARPVDLSDVDPAEVGALYQKARDGMESMQIQSKPEKFKCEYCFNALNCLDSKTHQGLPTARQLYYDRSAHDQPPF